MFNIRRTKTGIHSGRVLFKGLCLLFLLAPALCTNAYAAGEMFVDSSPSLYATLNGDCELVPGTDLQLSIDVENQGVDNEGLRGLQYASYSINPTTALGTMLDLRPGDAPVKVKTEPFLAGDIRAGETKSGSFYIHVDEDAPKGAYNLVLYTDYSYASAETMIEPGRWDYIYKHITREITIPVEIKGVVKPEIISVSSENLSPGSTGDITVLLQNSGYSTGHASAAALSGLSGNIRLVDGSVFTGEFAPKETKEIVFKAEVSEGVSAGIYPESLRITYTDDYGEAKTSDSEIFGISVSEGSKFKISSGPLTMSPGEETIAAVEFYNYGDETAYDAKARIIPDSPFTAPADTAILGDIIPGESVTADFKIKMDSDAQVIPYGIKTELKYRDKNDRLILSDQMMLEVETKDKNVAGELLTNPVFIAVIIGFLLLIIYFAGKNR